MKLKVQFGRETRFDIPVRGRTRNRSLWLPCIRVLLRVLALSQRPTPLKPKLAGGNCPKDSTP
jgi:hypothetical protein